MSVVRQRTPAITGGLLKANSLVQSATTRTLARAKVVTSTIIRETIISRVVMRRELAVTSQFIIHLAR